MIGGPRDAILAARVLAVGLLVPLIARLPLPAQARLLEPRRPRRSDARTERWLIDHVDRLLAAGTPLIRPGCLTRGLTHFYFLRRAGADVELAYGIGTIDGRTEGHCWLERDGEPFLERVDPRRLYVRTYAVPRLSP
jgi:Transglutaminase-like superfamily